MRPEAVAVLDRLGEAQLDAGQHDDAAVTIRFYCNFLSENCARTKDELENLRGGLIAFLRRCQGPPRGT